MEHRRCLDGVCGVDRRLLVWPGAAGGAFFQVTDEQREQLIEKFRLQMVAAPNRESRLAAMERMRELIAERSPQQVERMERECGLR